MLPRSQLRKLFQRVVRGGEGLLIGLLIGSGLVGTVHTAQTLSFPQDKTAASSRALRSQEMQALELGQPVERRLAGGESHSYRLTLAAGQYLRVVVEQRGIDVAIMLLSPEGEKIVEADRQKYSVGSESVSLIGEAAGLYRLDVRALDQNSSGGLYQAKIVELREATEQDRMEIATERTFMQGEWLLSQGTAESSRRAIKKFEEVLPLKQAVGDRRGEAITTRNISAAYFLLHEYRKSLELLNEALSLSRAAGDRQEEALILTGIGAIHERTGKMQKALEYYDQALPLRRAVGDRRGEAVTLNNIGNVYSALGEMHRALEYFNQALPVERSVSDHKTEVQTLNNIATVYYSLGENRKALEYFYQALPLVRGIGDRQGEAQTINNIAAVYTALDEIQKAFEHYQNALSLRRASGDRRGEAGVLHNIAAVYEKLGDLQTAMDYSQQSLPLRRATDDRQGEAATLSNIGRLYDLLGEKQKALEFLNQALQIRQDVGERRGAAQTLNNIAAAYYSMGENRKALDYSQQALSLGREAGDRRSEAVTLNNIATIHEKLDEPQKALEYHDQALLIRRAVSDPRGEAGTLYGIARIERKRGHLEQSLARLNPALAIIETLRTRTDVQELRASYFATVQHYYQLNTDLLMQLHKLRPSESYVASALQSNERARVRTLLDALTEARAGIREGVDPALLARERSLQQLLDAKVERMIRLLSGKQIAERIAAAKGEIETLRTEYQQVQAQIRATSPRYSALTQPQPLSLAKIQKQVLDADTLLLEYALGEERSYLWAVTKSSITGHELPPRAEIESAARNVYDLLTARNLIVKFEAADERQARIAQADAEYSKSAAALSRMLLSPVAGQLEKKRLLIVGDGALQYMPFAALPVPESGRAGEWERGRQGDKAQSAIRNPQSSTPLIVDHEVVSLPSASALAVLRQELAGRKPAPKTVAVLADPVFDRNDERLKASITKSGTKPPVVAQTRAAAVLLESDLTRSVRDLGLSNEGFRLPRLPFTRKEAQTILSLVPANERLAAFDFAASQMTATNPELAQYRYVHFATHGLLNPLHPELSGIVLSLFNEQGAEQDGFLRVHEIFNLNLPAELVVLSGCRTGLGKDVRGEGLIGLTRGFMYAGAARVLVSLWDVDDQSTSELMGRLYRGMLGKRQLAPAAALREAQVALWREKRWQAPYYWAAFTLQGEPR